MWGPICAFLASVTWAWGSAGYSRLSRGHSPFAVNFSRALVALPCFVVAAAISLGGPAALLAQLQALTRTEYLWLALSIFASYGLGDVFFMWSTRSLGVPSALAIASTFPILTTGYGLLFEGETLTAKRIAGVLLVVLGVITVILSQSEPTPASSEGKYAAPAHLTRKGTGILFAFATMLMWTLNSVGTATGARGLDPFVANVIRMVFALAMTTAFGRALAPGSEIVLPTKVIRKALPLFFVEAFGGSLVFFYGLSHSPLAVGAALASLAPVLAVPVAWLMGLEKVSLPRTVGVSAVVCGIWLLVL